MGDAYNREQATQGQPQGRCGRGKIVIAGHLGFETVSTPHGQGGGLGGSAYYAAVGATMSGANAIVMSTVGTDFPLDSLKELNINVSLVMVMPGISPHFTIEYLPTFSDRLVRFDLGVGVSIRVPNSADLTDVKYVHIATNLPDIQLTLAKEFRAVLPHAFLSVDCFDQFIIKDSVKVAEVLKIVDLFFANTREFELLQREGVIVPKWGVIKNGEQGATFLSPEYVRSAPSPHARLIDPTGAGDVFAGSFLAHLAQGFTPDAALEGACVLASAVVEGFSTTSLLRRRTE